MADFNWDDHPIENKQAFNWDDHEIESSDDPQFQMASKGWKQIGGALGRAVESGPAISKAPMEGVEPESDPITDMVGFGIASQIGKGAGEILGNEIGAIGDWKNHGIKFRHKDGKDGTYIVEALNPEGKIIGNTKLRQWDEGGTNKWLEAERTDVHPDYQRQGIATELYKLAEEKTGRTMFPSNGQSWRGQALWEQPNRPFGNKSSAESVSDKIRAVDLSIQKRK